MAEPQLYLFDAAGRAALRDFVDPGALFAFDLDGTLAPIVPDPSRIAVAPEISARLERLRGMAPVAVITGRSRADALTHLGFQPRWLVGNHGAEGLPGRETAESGYIRLSGLWEGQLRALLPRAGILGILVENKGATLSLHYRNAPDRRGAHHAILEAVERLAPPPKVLSGKCVVNILPRDAPGKGEALSLIMREFDCRRALFAGDDETDEEIFRLGSDAVFGIRVGFDSRSAARAYLREQSEILPLFDEIISLLESSPGPARTAPP